MVLIVAHRGLASKHPENTLGSISAALKAGFKAVEMDVRLTKDRKVVLMHDETIDRTTDGSGRVSSLRYRDMERFKSGNEKIPLLEDVLGRFSGKIHLCIEVKVSEAARPTVELIREFKSLRKASLWSFDLEALKIARSMSEEIDLGLILSHKFRKADAKNAERLKCKHIILSDILNSPKYTKTVKYRTGMYTVNSTWRAERYMRNGADLIITDKKSVLNRVMLIEKLKGG